MRKSIRYPDCREKMVGENLYEGSLEGAFKLWIEKAILK